MQRKKPKTMKILLANRKIKGNANPQIAHLLFAQADTQNQNCKRAISFCQPITEFELLKVGKL